MRKALALTTAAAAVAVGLAAQPATAAETLVTLAVGLDDPTLAIAAPAAVVTPGSPATALIATTVTDLRVSGTAWKVTIASSDLALSGVTTPGTAGTIPASTVTAYTGSTTVAVPGSITVTDGFSESAPLTLATTAKDLLVSSNRTNVNTVTYTTTLKIPTANKTQGVYTGTVTQSVV